jgi:hypothetical protein
MKNHPLLSIIFVVFIDLLGFSLILPLPAYHAETFRAKADGILNTLLSSTLTRAVEPQEVGGILGLAASVESATRIFAPVIGGALLQQLGTWAPGVFAAVVMAGVFLYVWVKIYNHPILASLKEQQAVAIPVSD